MKWFSRYNEPYSPDLNSWAVLTAFQNVVHALEDAGSKHSQLGEATRLMLTAETSCYWYWTGQHVWDEQVTNAANLGYEWLKAEVDGVVSGGKDKTGPTIFAPWVTPENPGGKKWGQGCLEDAAAEGVVHTFVYDIAGLKRVNLVLRVGKKEKTLKMKDNGPYPSRNRRRHYRQLLHRSAARRRRRRPLLHRGRRQQRQRIPQRPGAGVSGVVPTVVNSNRL